MGKLKLTLICVLTGLTVACVSLDKLTQYQKDVEAACAAAMLLSPIDGFLAPWIIGACGTEAALAKLMLDPNSLQWLYDLINKMHTANGIKTLTLPATTFYKN